MLGKGARRCKVVSGLRMSFTAQPIPPRPLQPRANLKSSIENFYEHSMQPFLDLDLEPRQERVLAPDGHVPKHGLNHGAIYGHRPVDVFVRTARLSKPAQV